MSNKNTRIILLSLATTLSLVACTPEDEKLHNDSSTSCDENMTVRIDEGTLLYNTFGDLRNVYGYEPFYTADEWMNDAGELLYPYENDKDRMEGIENILASLYMPEEVLKKASTEELLHVVCDGWLSTHATSAILFNLPSEYVANSMSRNQAANELIVRNDMVKVLLEDYTLKSYIKGNEYSDEAAFALNQIQFEEIILASNHAYVQMNDSMKEKVINAVLEKVSYMESQQYYTGNLKTGFFTYIKEEQENGGSYWYEYLCENEDEIVRKYLDLEETISWMQME